MSTICNSLTSVNYSLPPELLESAEDGGVFSVEILLDPVLERAVRDEWALLIEAGLPSAGRQTAPSNRPHITLAVRERVDAAAFAPVAEGLPLDLELGGI